MDVKRRKLGNVSADITEDVLLADLETFSRAAPFSEDDEAKERNKLTDYSIKISMEDARAGKAARRPRVYADGIYDMFHSGHSQHLMQVKRKLPNSYLIIGVCNDDLTLANKGRTVMNERERYEAVRHCRFVDEVLADAPWTLSDEFLEANKIDFVAHDDLPYKAGNTVDVYSELKSRGMFFGTSRIEGMSTTDVIARIIRDYDMFVRRNLSRGVSREALNLGYLQAKRIEVGGKIAELKGKTTDFIQNWSDRSGEFVQNFMERFQGAATINNWLPGGSRIGKRGLSPPAALPSPLENEDDSDD